MSRDVDITFEFAGEFPVGDFLGMLRGSGWIPDDHGVVRYLVDPDMFEWVEGDPLNMGVVLQSLENTRIGGDSCAIILTWSGSGIGGSFLVRSRGLSVTFSPTVNAVRRKDVPPLIDFEWYLSRLVRPLRDLGMTGYVITDTA